MGKSHPLGVASSVCICLKGWFLAFAEHMGQGIYGYSGEKEGFLGIIE